MPWNCVYNMQDWMATALITGISGFVGSHLARYLSDQGWVVAGFDLHQPHVECDFFPGNLSNGIAIREAIEKSNPHAVFHFAGKLKSDSHDDYYQIHVLGTISLMEALVVSGLSPRILIASSSAVYGSGFGRKPITEGFKPRPMTHYAASKLAQEIVALRYFNANDMPVSCVRTFNLLGPGLAPTLASSAFARQIAQAELRTQPSTILTGDLSAQRDFVDVRDAVRAYELIAQKGQVGQSYNVASGRPVSIQACLELLLKQARVPIDVVLDPARLQKNDIPMQIGSAKRLHELTGWEPEIAIEQSLSDLLNDWRQRV